MNCINCDKQIENGDFCQDCTDQMENLRGDIETAGTIDVRRNVIIPRNKITGNLVDEESIAGIIDQDKGSTAPYLIFAGLLLVLFIILINI